MMMEFSNSFLVFFQQIALGGMLALAFTPFHEIERAFYKSTAGVLYLLAAMALWGKMNLFGNTTTDQAGSAWFGIAVNFAFVAFFSGYMVSLWGERQVFRAQMFSLTILTGIVALIVNTLNLSSTPGLTLENFLFPTVYFAGALLLGSVTVGMLIGHWYLIDTGQSLEPFIRIFKFFVVSLIIQVGAFVISGALLYAFGSAASASAVDRLLQHHAILAASRIAIGHIAPLILAWMIWRTLLIPHTMAATGLFYIAMLGVFVGEILGRQILALTKLPF